MGLSATGRTLRIRRQTYASESPGWSEDGMVDEEPPAEQQQQSSGRGGAIRLKKGSSSKWPSSSKVTVRVQLDGPADNFSSGSVVAANIPANDEDDALSSDDELFKDVRTYLRQTMGKSAVMKAEAGICGIGEYIPEGRASQWLEGAGGNYVTVRHPPPDVHIDVPPLPVVSSDSEKFEKMMAQVKFKFPLTCAHWFDPRFVADIERAELGAIGISEDVYRELRDRILDAYASDPSKFLSVRNAREATGFGEIAVLVRVWSFLDYWGIINYYADPVSAPRFSKKLIDYPMGGRWAGDTKGVVITCCSCRKPCAFVAYALKSDAAPLIPKDQLALAKFCATCFNTNSYPPFFSRASFEPQDVLIPGTVNPEWTEEETMRLIEGIERFGLDWAAIASLICGGKTPAQCLLHFCQLPTQNSPVESRINTVKSSVSPKPNPFRDTSNAALSLLTILATTVPTDVGIAAAALVKTEDVEMKPEQ